MTQLIVQEQNGFAMSPISFSEAVKFAELMSQSDFVPKAFIGKPGNILVAIKMGHDLGLNPMAALQNIAVINGKPSIYGDAMIALVRASALCEYVHEEVDKSTDNWAGICRTKRRGEPEREERFDIAQAKKASLWGKQGPWSSYPERMLKMRARGFLLRDVYADILCGLITQEEAEDYPTVTVKEIKKSVIEEPKLIAGVRSAIDGPAARIQMHRYEDTIASLVTQENVMLLVTEINEDPLLEDSEKNQLVDICRNKYRSLGVSVEKE